MVIAREKIEQERKEQEKKEDEKDQKKQKKHRIKLTEREREIYMYEKEWLEAAKGDSRWDALVISQRDGYFDPMEFYSAPSSEPQGEDDAVASLNAFNAC
nr:hypothetical protein [Tanacetum cinerariifolium]